MDAPQIPQLLPDKALEVTLEEWDFTWLRTIELHNKINSELQNDFKKEKNHVTTM